MLALAIGWLTLRRHATSATRRQKAGFLAATAAYVGLMVTAYVQAMREQSVVSPDLVTW